MREWRGIESERGAEYSVLLVSNGEFDRREAKALDDGSMDIFGECQNEAVGGLWVAPFVMMVIGLLTALRVVMCVFGRGRGVGGWVLVE